MAARLPPAALAPCGAGSPGGATPWRLAAARREAPGGSRRRWSATQSVPFGAAIATGLFHAFHGHRGGRRRGKQLLRVWGRTACTAVGTVLEGDAHACAVRKWLDEFVIGLSFCPWAKPVDEAGGIRVVTSTAETEEGVLAVLRTEAERLPQGEATAGEATTTLIVFPDVPNFTDFDEFHIFFSEKLEEGNLFIEDFGLKIVAFHPDYELYGMGVEAGDRVAVAGPDGKAVTGTVIDEAGGLHPDDGEELLEVRFDDGEEFLVRYGSLVGVLGGDEGCGDAANLVSRAPRPMLHLLRLEDLDHASAMGDTGAGLNVQAVLEKNVQRATDLGAEGVEEILRRCG